MAPSIGGKERPSQLEKPASRPKPNKPEVSESGNVSEAQIDFQREQQTSPNDSSDEQRAIRNKTDTGNDVEGVIARNTEHHETEGEQGIESSKTQNSEALRSQMSVFLCT